MQERSPETMKDNRLCVAFFAAVLLVLASSTGADAFVAIGGRRLIVGRHPREALSSVTRTGVQSAVAVALIADQQSAVAGKVFPLLSTFALTPAKCRRIIAALTDSKIDPAEFVFMAAIGWGLVPALRLVRARGGSTDLERGGDDGDATAAAAAAATTIADDDDDDDDDVKRRAAPFETTYTSLAVELAGEASKIGCAVYAVDCLALALSVLGLKSFAGPQQRHLALGGHFARAAYAVWATLRVRDLKHYLLHKYALKRSRHRAGKLKVCDRLLNAVLFLAAGMVLLDNVGMGRAASSLLSLGGIGTLVLSLASKDQFEQFVAGLSVSTSDRFYEGDEIKLGDEEGSVIVTKIGWTHTEMRNPDQTITSIPNSNIFNQRITNMSRVYKSQVKQTLRFSYDDLDQIDEVCDAILESIQHSECGSDLIKSRVPWVHWRNYECDHLEVVVDARFNVPPIGARYFDNKQRVLNAIGKAVRGCGVDFTLPTQMEISIEKKEKTRKGDGRGEEENSSMVSKTNISPARGDD